MIKVNRPTASKNKISHKSSFELCYLRHQYFRRAKYNPTEAEMAPYIGIISKLAKNTFFVYANLFRAVGMDYEDIQNIGRVHLVSFLCLYSMESSKEKKDQYIERIAQSEYRIPEEKDFDQKNKANFTFFLKQRMEDLVRVCRQKVRNINGHPSSEYVAFCGKANLPKNIYRLMKNYEELGYKKIDFSIFKSIRKKCNFYKDSSIFKLDDTWYVALDTEQKKITQEDIEVSDFSPYENSHNLRPDELYVEKESNLLYDIFENKPSFKKIKILRKFIAKNKLNRQYREEILTARKLLKNLGE